MVIQFCRIAKIENLEIHFLFQILAVVITLDIKTTKILS